MKKLQILHFLKPDMRELVLFSVLAFICVGGVIQTYAFLDDVPGIPKPSLYDVLRPLELWFPWIILTLPTHFLGRLLNVWWLLRYFPEISPGFSFPLVSVIYAYILSCWTFHVWDKWLSKSPRRKLFIIAGIILAAIFNPPITLLWAPFSLDYLLIVISGFIFLFLIFTVYAISIYGLYKVARSFISE